MMSQSIIKLYAKLKERENIIRLHQFYDQGVEGNVATGLPREKAERLTLANLIMALSEECEEKCATEFTLNIVHGLREGGRWQELIDAVASPEILLIGVHHSEENDEEDSDEDEIYIPNIRKLEKEFYKDYKSLDIAKITRSGDDSLFAKMKELLMLPDLHLKETCQCLSGLSQLVNRLSGEIKKDFVDLRNIGDALTKNVGRKNSELVISLCSEIKEQIRAVLWKSDDVEPEMDPLFSEMAELMINAAEQKRAAESEIDGKKSSSNDYSSEDTCGSNVGGQNKEFSEDFCIQFLNNDAFS